jgi:hypothetical protein
VNEAERRKVYAVAVDAAKKVVPTPYGFKNHNELAAALMTRIAKVNAERDALDAELDAERRRAQQQQAWIPMTATEVATALLDCAVPAELLAEADDATDALLATVPAPPVHRGAGKQPSMRARPQLMDVLVSDVVADALAEIERIVPGDFLDAMGVDTPRKSRTQRPQTGTGVRLCF